MNATKAQPVIDSDMFIQNMTDQRLTIDVDNGKTINIPVTFIPINVTLHVKREDVEHAPSFKRACQMKLVRVVQSDDAKQMLSSKDAQLEIERLYPNQVELNRLRSRVRSEVFDDGAPVTENTDVISPDTEVFNMIVNKASEGEMITTLVRVFNQGRVNNDVAMRIATWANENEYSDLYSKVDELTR